MKLLNYVNNTGEGVVTFEPWRVQGPEYEIDHSRWYCHIKVSGERIFEYGCPCGTCGIIFRKVGSVTHRLSDIEAIQLLGTLDTIPSNSVLQRLARILEPGLYHPMILEGKVQRIEPGTSDDYFATEVVRLFGLEPPDYDKPSNPGTSYYKLGLEHDLQINKNPSGLRPLTALVTAIIMPLHDPSQLNRERIEFWKMQYSTGAILTAFAVSVIDKQSPYDGPKDNTYRYEEQFLFTNCVLDGHHRIQAAVELGAPVRILSLLTRKYSLVENTDEIITVSGWYAK